MSAPEPSDAAVLSALRHEPEQVALLYDRYARRLVRHLQSEGASEEVALDATQETFARLIVRRRRVRPAPDGTIWPWLVVTGRNLVRDWQRRGKVERRARQRLGLALGEDAILDSNSRLDAGARRAELRAALASLSPHQRAAVYGRVVDELEYPQLARATGSTEQAARRRVSRGLRAMQTFLEGGRQ